MVYWYRQSIYITVGVWAEIQWQQVFTSSEDVLAPKPASDDNRNIMSHENTSQPNESSPFGDKVGGDKTFTSVEAVLARYMTQWRQGPPPEIGAFLPASDQPQRIALLEKLIAVDLAERLRAGQTARLEDYLARFAELGGADDLPSELIVAEYHARLNQGESLDLEEYARRFPAQINRLRSEFSTHAYVPNAEDEPVVSLDSVSLDFDPGSVLDDFEIECLLGVGSYARVYLAKQISLERRVVLKVSRVLGAEGRTLAQLEHPHIASVFSEQTVSGRTLLAMRYVPGKTLADWMSHRNEIDTATWRGKDLLAWLDEQTASLPGRKDLGGRDEFAALRFVPAMCRMVLGLARALQHSHEQGVMHRDIKPANILIDLAGRALLMDFNVAARRTGRSKPDETSLGGTLAYMAPEHLAALQADVSGSAAEVDQRSDVYGLGVVFFELLSGRHPWPHGETSSATPATIRQLTASRLQGTPQLPSPLPGVTPGLRSILRKCLAPLPQDRYQSAAELADDLQRLQEHRALAVARDPSPRERLAKWMRRHPKALTVAVTVAVLLAALAIYGGWRDLRRFNRAESLVAEAAAATDAGRSQIAAQNLMAAQSAIIRPNVVLPERFTVARRDALNEQLATLVARVARSELQRFEQLADARRVATFGRSSSKDAWDLVADPLEVYGVLDGNDWEQLPHYRRLDPADRIRVAEDITELLAVRVIAMEEEKTDAASFDSRAVNMLDLLARVPAIYRNAPPIELLRRHVQQKRPGRVETARLVAAAAGEFDYYLAGVIAAQRGEFTTAIECQETALQKRPDDQPPRFWARFLHAHCCERAQRDDEAIADYGICIGLRRDFAWPYHNLGLIYTKRGRYALAEKNLQEAVRLDPKLAEARANLGVIQFQLQRYDAARRSFDQAIELGYQTAEVYSNRAATREALDDRKGAREDLEHALKIDPQSEAARQNLEQLNKNR